MLWCICGLAQNLTPLSESFEGDFPPQGWTLLHVSGGTNWEQTTSLAYCAGAQDGTHYVIVPYGQGNNYLITPKLYPQAGESITFYMGIEGLSYNLENTTTVEVSTSGTDPANFTVIRTLTVADFTMEDNWYSFSVNLGAYAGQSIYVAFHNVITSSSMFAGGNVYLDNVNGPNMEVPSCTTPSGLATQNITPYSVNLIWTSDADDFIVYLRAAGESAFTEFTGASLITNDSIYPIDDLEPGTTYEWYVAAVCNDTFSSQVATFTTACVAQDPELLPYFTSFNECPSIGELPNCWTRIEGSGYFPGAYSLAYLYSFMADDTILRFTPDSIGYHWVSMPAFDEDIHLLRVKFQAKPYGTESYYGRMEIGLLENLGDTANFEVVSTIVAAELPNSDYVTYTVPFSQTTLSGNGLFVCFRCIGENGSVWYLDDVTLEYMPQCVEPSGLEVNEITSTTAALSWIPGDDTQTEFTIHYKAQNASQWQTVDVSISDSAYEILYDLQHSTSYEAYVTAPCAPSSQTNHVTFSTTCMPVESYSLPYLMDFENVEEYELPTCWTLLHGNTFNYGVAPCAYGYNSAHNSNQSIRFYTNVNDSVNMVALPPIDEEIHLLRMNFWIRPGGNMTAYGRMEIGVISNLNDLSTFEVVETITASQLSDNNYHLYSIPFDLTLASGYENLIAFRQVIPSTTSTNGYAWYVDDITVELIPDCYEPSNLSWTGSTATTADLTWAPGDSTQTDFTLHYCIQGSTTWDTLSVTVSNSYIATLTNLIPNTTYMANITADCAPDHPSQPVTFTTECTGITAENLPMSWNFENDNPAGTVSNPLPLCWKRSPDEPYEDPYYPFVYSNSMYAYEGSKMLYFADEEGYAILPPLDDSLEINTLQISFFARGNTDLLGQTNYTTHFQVGVMTDPYDVSTFSMVQAFSVTGENYVPVEISFANYQGAGKYISIKQLENADYYNRGYIDLVTLDYIAECERPFDLYADNITATSAQLHWTSTASLFKLYYKSEWDDEFTTVNNIIGNAYTLQNLPSSTDIEWYVTAMCSDTMLDANHHTFTTACDVYSVSSTPWMENFSQYENQDVPDCWTRLSEFMLYTTQIYPSVDTYYELRSPNLMMFVTDNDTNLIALPQFAESLNTLRLYFSAKAAYPEYDNLEVGIVSSSNSSNSGTFTVIATLNAQDYFAELDELTPYIPFVVDLDTVPNLSGRLALRLTCSEPAINQWHLTDFKVMPIPACSEPLNLSVSNITTNSVDLSWSSDAESFDLYYKRADMDDFQVINNITLTNGVYTLTGLTTGTHYEWYVVAHCSATETSEHSLTHSFMTECDVISEFPYTEGFEYGMGCWTTDIIDGNYPWVVVINPQFAHESNGCTAFLYYYGNSAELISPVFDLSEYESAQLSYDLNLRSYNNVFDSLGVFYRTAETAPWTYLTSHIHNNGYTDYHTVTLDLPNLSATYQVMFLGEALNGNSILLDNISITVSPIIEPDTCPTPTDLQQLILVKDGAGIRVTWTDNADATQWNLQYRLQNGNGDWTTVTVNGEPTYSITGLENNGIYEIRVQAVCDEDNLSDWSAILTATATHDGIDDYLMPIVNVFPNPAKTSVTVECTMNDVRIDVSNVEIYDVYGKLIATAGVTNNSPQQTRIDVSGLANGIYFVRVATDKGIVTKRIVKN